MENLLQQQSFSPDADEISGLFANRPDARILKPIWSGTILSWSFQIS